MAAALVVLLVLLSEAAADKDKVKDKDVVQVKPGDDVTLTCRAAGVIRAVEWTREDLKDKYVLFYRGGRTETGNQDPSFRDRVQLSDRKLKDGDVSLILKNVNINDAGTYKCEVNKLIRRIQLEVSDVVHVKPGDDVILTCRAAGVIRAVKWTREDLEDKYVLFYRDGQTETDRQDPSFKDRVQLLGSELKDGDVSLILRNVNINDAGTYECRVASGVSRQKRAPADDKLISRVHLEVSGSDSIPPDGNVGVGVGVAVAVVLLVCSAVVVLFLVRKNKRQTVQEPVSPPPDEAADDHLI